MKGYEVNYLKGQADNAFLMDLSWYVNGLRGRIDSFVKSYVDHKCLEKLAKDIVSELVGQDDLVGPAVESNLYWGSDKRVEAVNSFYRLILDMLKVHTLNMRDEIGASLVADSKSMLVPSTGPLAQRQMMNTSSSLASEPLEFWLAAVESIDRFQEVLQLVPRARAKVQTKTPQVTKTENPLSVLTFMLASRKVRPLSSYYTVRGSNRQITPLVIRRESPPEGSVPDVPDWVKAFSASLKNAR